MVIRWISLIALGLTLSSCQAPGFNGSTRQFSGVWLYEFEGSTFVEGETGIPPQRPAYEEADWLEWPVDQPRLEALLEENPANLD